MLRVSVNRNNCPKTCMEKKHQCLVDTIEERKTEKVLIHDQMREKMADQDQVNIYSNHKNVNRETTKHRAQPNASRYTRSRQSAHASRHNVKYRSQRFGSSENEESEVSHGSEQTIVRSYGIQKQEKSNDCSTRVPKFVQEAIGRQMHWTVDSLIKWREKTTEDMKVLLQVVSQNECSIHKLLTSSKELEEKIMTCIKDLTAKFAALELQVEKAGDHIKKNQELLLQSHTKGINDMIVQINKENDVALGEINDEMEALVRDLAGDLVASDQRNRIHMESVRFRIYTSSSYVKNAIRIIKVYIMEALGMTTNKLTTSLKDERFCWTKDLGLFKQSAKENKDTMHNRIHQLESELRCMLDDLSNNMFNLEKMVESGTSENENYRKLVRSYMTACNSLSDELSDEIKEMQTDVQTKLEENVLALQSIGKDYESEIDARLKDNKTSGDILDRQIQYISRLVRILLFHVAR